ncbi:hypothetical protein TBLA_0B06130 [Henningerozyma blattae CBS 6284]|uniref:Mitochondrial distribution and morphology protein 31 n=1 Tax=Henningerozyma blattae (strain ATCC 34711 / CBS 6284 / DSM 70876 / NBRC 10599 / NRRL Y-10934 / UCD 77-7) TaxID=1071380 RepID=I2GZ87_HENB6|nr:hypothetical protein TBLA_0B06130 [Tetrapisispora blattae CBS 6284]CCH59439.1 hypothetical protein TBLA_0B06130 [Tetrapisispora blattae CBS 6284]
MSLLRLGLKNYNTTKPFSITKIISNSSLNNILKTSFHTSRSIRKLPIHYNITNVSLINKTSLLSSIQNDNFNFNRSIHRSTTFLQQNNLHKNEPINNHDLKFITDRDRQLAKTQNIAKKLKINLRWLLTRSTDPLSKGTIGTVISWVIFSNALIFLFATTTFLSAIIYLMNSLFAQEYLATKVGEFLTKNLGVSVVFENAIVPDWRSGKITFNKVFISRRPNLSRSFGKGSQKEAAERARLALSAGLLINRGDFDDGNYTQYDLTIDQIEISLSFSKWINGTGILDELSISGLRGVVDRTHVNWAKNDDPRNYLNKHKPGDFEIEKFVMNDVLFTMYQPKNFRPIQISIFNCDLPRLRKHWLLYDILHANSISGTYDNSMFTIHRKFVSHVNDSNKDKLIWSKMTRLRVDNLDVDHLNAGDSGPFGWITEGKVDMLGDVMLPDANANFSQLQDIIHVIGDGILKEAKNYSEVLGSTIFLPENSSANKEIFSQIEPSEYMIIDLSVKLHNVKAEVPLFTSQLGYINNALIRPIVGYINSRRTYIPIRCRIIKNVSDFEGSWTVYDSLLLNDISEEVYNAFAEYVSDSRKKSQRIRRVGFWSLQLFIQIILLGVSAFA